MTARLRTIHQLLEDIEKLKTPATLSPRQARRLLHSILRRATEAVESNLAGTEIVKEGQSLLVEVLTSLQEMMDVFRTGEGFDQYRADADRFRDAMQKLKAREGRILNEGQH